MTNYRPINDELWYNRTGDPSVRVVAYLGSKPASWWDSAKEMFGFSYRRDFLWLLGDGRIAKNIMPTNWRADA